MDKIHIVLADYDPKGKYSVHVAVAMSSLLYNTKSAICFHITHDETLTEENKTKLTETVKQSTNRYGLQLDHEIDFVNISRYYDNCKINLDLLCKSYSPGTTYYLTLPQALSETHKVIVIDSDTVTTLDVTELWNTRLNGCMLAAVSDVGDGAVPGIDNPEKGSHINTGVMLLDLDGLRRDAVEKGPHLIRFFKFLEQYKPRLIEQEFMSSEFYGKILFLDKRYNTLQKNGKEDLSLQKIWHFAQRKPWDELIGSNVELLYWEYLQKTPWKNELLEMFYFAATNGGHLHRHTKDCFKKMALNVKLEIKRAVAKLTGSKKFIKG